MWRRPPEAGGSRASMTAMALPQVDESPYHIGQRKYRISACYFSASPYGFAHGVVTSRGGAVQWSVAGRIGGRRCCWPRPLAGSSLRRPFNWWSVEVLGVCLVAYRDF